MKPPFIDFAAPVARRDAASRRLVLAGGVCLVLALLGIAVGLHQASQAATLEALVSERAASREALESAVSAHAQLSPDAAEAVNGVVRMMAYPLVERLNRIEQHTHDGIRPVSIEAGPVRANLRLVFEAPSLPQALDYLEELRTEAGFEGLSLIRQEPGLAGDGQTWKFTMELPQQDSVARATETPKEGQ